MERLTNKKTRLAKGGIKPTMLDVVHKLAEYEDLGITPDQIKELDKKYTEKCSQIKEIVKRLEKEAEEARAGGNPEISGAYIRSIYIIKEIAEGWPELTDDKLIDLVIKKAEKKFEIESGGKQNE